MPKLTAAAIGKYRPAKARREIPDAGCPGLYLLVQPSGARGFALRYRRPDGRPAKLVLGTAFISDHEPDTDPVVGGHLTLAAAHRLVAELRHQIAQGKDPAADHLAAKQHRRASSIEGAANTFGKAAKDFVEQYSAKKVRRWKEQARLLGINPKDLTPIPKGLAERWGSRSVAEIDGHDIHALIEETRERGAPGLERRSEGETESRARAMLSCLSRMFRWLMQHRRVETNPCAGVHRPEAPSARDRVLAGPEIIKFWTATDLVGEPVGQLLKVLLLTGCRLNEVARMRRAELSDDLSNWSIPGSRTKNGKPHLVPLPPLARDIISTVKRVEDCDLVFVGRTCKTPPSGWAKVKRRLDRAMSIPPWRLHDLRRTAATGMAEIGIAPHIVEASLNHVSGAKAGVAGTYNRAAYGPEKKAALERWAAHVEGLVTVKSATVISLHKAKSS